MRMTTKHFAAATATLLLANSAFALDGYRSRRGVLYGVGLGLGAGELDGAGSERRLGLSLRGRAGGGITEKLTLDAELGWHRAAYEENTLDITNSLYTIGMGVNFFAVEELYLRGALGMAKFEVDVEGTADSETQLYYGLGLGYEFFANSDLAVGIGADVLLTEFDGRSYNLVNFGVTLIHY